VTIAQRRPMVCVPGQRFARLTMIVEMHPVKGSRVASFRCDCGSVLDAYVANVVKGRTKSCGCLWRDMWNAGSLQNPPIIVVHGQATRGVQTAEYTIWLNMIGRCHNPRHPSFQHYGGRGITVCDRWRSFACFFEDVGKRPVDRRPNGRAIYSLDRIDNDRGYEPGNVRWATQSEQVRNSRRYTR
jgi:hypothetical protein